MKRILRFTLLTVVTFLSTLTNVYADDRFDAVAFSKDFIRLLDIQFGTDIKLSVGESILPLTSDSCPRATNNRIVIQKNDLEDYGAGLYGASSQEALAFVLAHEFSHFMLAEDPDDEVRIQLPEGAVQYVASKVDLKLISSGVGYDLGHENVDGFAVKLLRQLGYGFEGTVLMLADGLIRYPSRLEKRPDQRSEEVMKWRIEKARISYREGWSSWSGYNRITRPCTRRIQKTYDYLAKIGAKGILDIFSSESCTYFPKEDIAKALSEAIVRYRLVE